MSEYKFETCLYEALSPNAAIFQLRTRGRMLGLCSHHENRSECREPPNGSTGFFAARASTRSLTIHSCCSTRRYTETRNMPAQNEPNSLPTLNPFLIKTYGHF